MKEYSIKPIGVVKMADGPAIEVYPEYIPALTGLDGFSHLSVIWWFSQLDADEYRSVLQGPQPYVGAPDVMGIFATRSPMRPNPLALTAAEVFSVDYDKGIIKLAWIDAEDGTPVMDIKPYTPSCDRIENPDVPGWCEHWPKSMEASADFDWDKEFNF